MKLAFESPWLLWLLPLAVLPWFGTAFRVYGYPSLSIVADDALSLALSVILKGAGTVAWIALVLALAGLHGAGDLIERTGSGARIVLLIDRSSSMNDGFAYGRSGEDESKSSVAKRLIVDFIARRPRDRLGVAVFSTSPMQVLALTDRHDAVKAAVMATDRPGLTMTNVGLGLASAIAMLSERGASSPGAVVLVSDGASVISPQVQATLREMAARSPFNLYWLFLRSEGSPGIFAPAPTPEQDTPYRNPERHLHLFLGTLGIPYRAFEAGSAQAVQQAVVEIDRQESRTMRYYERTPQRDLRSAAYVCALVSTLLLLLAKLMERPPYAQA
jgi:mxaC protein